MHARRLVGLLLLTLAAAGVASAAQEAEVISTGKRFKLEQALTPESTTVLLFIQDSSAMENDFLAQLERELPTSTRLALRVVRLKRLKARAARDFQITATPTAIVYSRFGEELGRSSQPNQIRAAVRKGLLMARIHWIDEDDPAAPEFYGRPAEALKQGIPGIVKTFSLRRDVFQVFMGMSQIHFSDGFLKRREHELIAAYTSALNKCKF